MHELTHRYDPETGRMIQIVSPRRLREILLADGEDLSKPSWLGAEDEWDVGEWAIRGLNSLRERCRYRDQEQR